MILSEKRKKKERKTKCLSRSTENERIKKLAWKTVQRNKQTTLSMKGSAMRNEKGELFTMKINFTEINANKKLSASSVLLVKGMTSKEKRFQINFMHNE